MMKDDDKSDEEIRDPTKSVNGITYHKLDDEWLVLEV